MNLKHDDINKVMSKEDEEKNDVCSGVEQCGLA
jgi:hypothetical protein